MAFLDLPLDAPEKPNKGHEGGACNRRSCQAEPALWWNHGSHSWYCGDCARDIGEDPMNKRDWQTRFQPQLGHPMFETREMMDARERSTPATTYTVYRVGREHPISYKGFVALDNRKPWVKANDAPKRPRRGR